MSTYNNISVQLMVSKTNYYTKACNQNNLHCSYSWKKCKGKVSLATMQNMTLLCMHCAEFIIISNPQLKNV